MIRCRHAVTIAFSAIAASGCGTLQDRHSEDSSAQEIRSHLAEQHNFQVLRERIRAISRAVALDVPPACDSAVAAVADLDTKSQLLSIAASSGIYAAVRCSAADPRAGLADLVITFATLRALYVEWAKDPEYKGLQPVVDALEPIVADLWKLSEKWLPQESLALLHSEVDSAVEKQEARSRSTSVHGARARGETGAPGGLYAPSAMGLEIRSSFLSFNDNGLLEYGLGEAHYIRLSSQAIADCLALMPGSMEYHARNSMLWAAQQSGVQDLQAKLDKTSADLQSLQELQELRALRPLARVTDAPWTLGGAVALLLLGGMGLQAYILGRAMRTRG